MNMMQHYIDNGVPIDLEKDFLVKDGSTFFVWLRVWWGPQRYSYGVERTFTILADKYGWAEVFAVVEAAAKMNKMTVRYCEVACEKRAAKREEQARAMKLGKLVRCDACETWHHYGQRCGCKEIKGHDGHEGQGQDRNLAPTEDVDEVREILNKWKERDDEA